MGRGQRWIEAYQCMQLELARFQNETIRGDDQCSTQCDPSILPQVQIRLPNRRSIARMTFRLLMRRPPVDAPTNG